MIARLEDRALIMLPDRPLALKGQQTRDQRNKRQRYLGFIELTKKKADLEPRSFRVSKSTVGKEPASLHTLCGVTEKRRLSLVNPLAYRIPESITLINMLMLEAVKRRQWAGGGSAVGACVGHLLVCEETGWGKPGERRKERENEKKEGKRARKRQGLVVLGSGEENPRVLLGDADQESETRMSKNALRTGRRQAVEKKLKVFFLLPQPCCDVLFSRYLLTTLQHVGDRLNSRFGPVNWPPRSCDLTPLDYFLWGYVKSLVYADKPQTLDHLEDNIRRVIADIRPQMLEKVIENWTSRLDHIRASRGNPMPEIIFKM
ncbi:putative DD41D transposase [Trichonephila clavipes]|nr:putative DD41D transposase [Trichonephila clavipes]